MEPSTLPPNDGRWRDEIPCGIEGDDAAASYPACVRTRILTFHEIVPSPYALGLANAGGGGGGGGGGGDG